MALFGAFVDKGVLTVQDRRGFTLIEVVVALVILTVVILGISATVARFIHTVATSDRSSAAIQLAEDRIAQVQMDPNYTTLDSLYATTETSFPPLTGYTRQTTIVRTTGSSQDYKKITVVVSGPGLTAPVSRTVTRAAP